MFQVRGLPQLRRRLKAVEQAPRGVLRKIQLDAVRYGKQRVPRKTGHLGRSIRPGDLARDYTIVKATAKYAAYVELGTKPHVIKPRNKRVLAWPAAGSARLSGSTRRGGKRIFAKVVHHPGTKAQPYLLPGAKQAVEENVGRDVVVRAWNDAA